MSRKPNATTSRKKSAPAKAYRKQLQRPSFWIVAGANGSGKSSFYTDTELTEGSGSVWIVNPDFLTARIQSQEKLDLRQANIAAATRIYAWLEASIQAYQTIGVETVLSTDKYRPLVLAARKKGFEIHLIYVVLESAALNVERVALRVRNGGHDVPREKIIERRKRSLEQLPWFLAHADIATIYDNSNEPQEIGVKTKDGLSVAGDALKEIADAFAAAATLKIEAGRP